LRQKGRDECALAHRRENMTLSGINNQLPSTSIPVKKKATSIPPASKSVSSPARSSLPILSLFGCGGRPGPYYQQETYARDAAAGDRSDGSKMQDATTDRPNLEDATADSGKPGECVADSTRQTYSGPAGTENVGVCLPKIELCKETDAGTSYRVIQEEVLPQPPGACIGIDYNCDGEITNAKLGEEMSVIDTVGNPDYAEMYPAMVWNGSEFGISWGNYSTPAGNYDIYFTRVSGEGIKIGQNTKITTCGAQTQICPGGTPISLAWNGSEYGVSWQDGRNWNEGTAEDIYFTRIDQAGIKIGDDIRITNLPSQSWYPHLVWNGNEYGLSWSELGSGIYFARLDNVGNKLTGNIELTNQSTDMPFSFIWTGSNYALSWTPGEMYFMRSDSAGNIMGNETMLPSTGYRKNRPSLAWTGTEYGLAWSDSRFWGSGTNSEIYLSKLDSNGNLTGLETRITNTDNPSDAPSLAWTGTDFGVCWEDSRDGYGYNEIYFAQISAAGEKIGEDLKLSNIVKTTQTMRLPQLVWNGDLFGACWADNREGNSKVYFVRIGCQ